MRRLLGVLTFALFLSCRLGNAQSFDCAKATSPTERAICDDELLGERDVSLAGELKSALADAPDQNKFLLDSERRWLVKRDTLCLADGAGGDQAQRSCLESAYDSRLSELRALAAIRRETTASAPEAERILGVWDGTFGPNSDLPIELIVQQDQLYWGTCTRMQYRVVGKKDNRFYLEVSAPSYCMGAGAKGLYFELSVLSVGNSRGLGFRDCQSAEALLRLVRNPSDGGVACSSFILDESQEDAGTRAARLDSLDREGGCEGHRTFLTASQVALKRALGFNQEAKVKQILAHPVGVNFASADGWTPLGIAVEQQNLNMVKALLAAGARRRIGGTLAAKCGAGFDDDVLGLIPSSPYDPPGTRAIRKALLGD
jgi:uncharacterized protein